MVYRDPIATHERVRRMVRRRRHARRARTASLAVFVLAVLGGAAFGVDRGVVYGAHLWAEHHRPHASVPNTTPVSTTTTIPGPPRCTNSQLNAYLYNWQITNGTLYEVVALADVSSNACTLAGYVGFTVTSTQGGSLPAPVHDDPAMGLTAGASSLPVTVMPGQRAWFEFSYGVTCTSVLGPGQAASGAPGECYDGSLLGVVVPQSTVGINVLQPVRFSYAASGFTVGPFGSGSPPTSPPISQASGGTT